MLNWKYLVKTIKNILLKLNWKKVKNIKFKLTLKKSSLQTVRNVSSIWKKRTGLKSWASRSHRKYLVKIELKNCKISGNFGDLDILTDAAVPETVETLVQKQPTTENKVASLDYTAFMINKESQCKCLMKIVIEFIPSLKGTTWSHDSIRIHCLTFFVLIWNWI